MSRAKPPFPLPVAAGMYHAGESIEAIARVCECDADTVRRRLRGAGIKVPYRPRTKPTKRPPDAVERREDIMHLRDKGGLTFAAIGEVLGVSRQRAHWLYQRAQEEALNKDGG